METIIFSVLFLAGITLITALFWSFCLIVRGDDGAVGISQVIFFLCCIFFPCTIPVALVLLAISLPLIPVLLILCVLALALLPLLFLANSFKNRFFPASNLRTLFEVDDQQNHTQSSYNAPSNGSNQVAPEEISTSNSMPVFLRKRAQRLGLTSASAPVPIPTPGSSSHPANSANGQPTVSSQSAPVEPVDPTLLPPSEDVPGQTIYRRIIPIKP
jgi:hypothetical protein